MLKPTMRTNQKTDSPVFYPVPARTKTGVAGRFGGRWNSVAQPRPWLDTDRELAGYYPFITGTNRPKLGVPIGYDITNGSAVAMDHHSLYAANAITAPNAMMFGLNGFGKSSLSLLVAASLNGMGSPMAIFDPVKGEYVDYAREVGCDVFSVGTGSAKDKINPMSRGPLAAVGARIGGEAGAEMVADSVAKVADNITALVRINRGQKHDVSDAEEAMIGMAVERVLADDPEPSLHGLLRFFDHPSAEAIYAAGLHESQGDEFKATYKELFRSISALAYGEFKDLFSEKGTEISPGNPAGFCFDSSALPSSAEKKISAVMLSTWRLGMEAIDAHWELAQWEAQQEQAAHQAGERFERSVFWRGYTSVQDEFWFPVRMAPGMVNEVDRLSRTTRSVGVGTWQITHSPKDFLMLPNEADRTAAEDLIKKCGLWVLMALSDDDLNVLDSIRPLQETERNQVKAFLGGSQGLEKAQARKEKPGERGGPEKKKEETPPPAGVGKALWKVGESLGIAVKSPKPASLEVRHRTATRMGK